MKGRIPPPRTADQQRQAERIAALRSGDVGRMRAWAERHGVALLGDEQTVLISYHESRALEAALSERVTEGDVRLSAIEKVFVQAMEDCGVPANVAVQVVRRVRAVHSIPSDVDQVIEEYHHRRARGQRVTLKEIAEEAVISYDYLRKRKSICDRANKKAAR